MRGGMVEALAIDHQVPVVANLDALAAHRHHSFDIELVLRHGRKAGFRVDDSFGFKNQNFAACWSAKIVSEAIDEKMVAGEHPGFKNIVASMIEVAWLNSRLVEQSLPGRPESVPGFTDPEALFVNKGQNHARRFVSCEYSVAIGNFVVVGIAVDPIISRLFEPGGNLEVGFIAEVFRDNAEKGRLHRASRDFEWFQEEGMDGDGNGDSHQHDLDVFS